MLLKCRKVFYQVTCTVRRCFPVSLQTDWSAKICRYEHHRSLLGQQSTSVNCVISCGSISYLCTAQGKNNNRLIDHFYYLWLQSAHNVLYFLYLLSCILYVQWTVYNLDTSAWRTRSIYFTKPDDVMSSKNILQKHRVVPCFVYASPFQLPCL